ncbi:hypothetical protein EDD18DRAFT_1107167 [Armillaria luteobubalina]|uniref:Uncharacterized protein n=1 Tax=Armillaria luteobubalina TaxID=153913 RepID=A0AA39Q1T2_9AGAR|nr:hypothetical protein EDD18DRAFT_1107167 [Armillaria luteobubalina]
MTHRAQGSGATHHLPASQSCQTRIENTGYSSIPRHNMAYGVMSDIYTVKFAEISGKNTKETREAQTKVETDLQIFADEPDLGKRDFRRVTSMRLDTEGYVGVLGVEVDFRGRMFDLTADILVRVRYCLQSTILLLEIPLWKAY